MVAKEDFGRTAAMNGTLEFDFQSPSITRIGDCSYSRSCRRTTLSKLNTMKPKALI